MVNHALIALAVALLSGFGSALLVPRLTVLAHRLGLLQYPRERDAHVKPIPRIGGLAMYIGFLVGLGVSFAFPVERFPIEVERILLLVIGSALVVAIMLYDDLLGVAPIPKLAWQAAAAAIVVLPRLRGPDHGLAIDQFTNPFGGIVHLPVLIAVGFTFFWILGMMNTLNWIDGLDGLAGSVTFIACAVLFLHTFFRPEGNPQFTISLLPAALGAAIIGFLPFNWYPSKIIMGDTGAMFLGFSLAVISIIGGAKIATALLTLWVPILDIAWVIVYRLINGRAPWKADRGHLQHRLIDLGWSQRQIVIFYAIVTALLGISSLLVPWPEWKLFGLIALGVVGMILLAILAKRSERVSDHVVSEL